MPEPVDPAAQRKPARPRRTRKFVLPEHHHDEQVDERTAEHIEAFLDGSASVPRRPRLRPDRAHRPFSFDTRQDWTTALGQESARHARYGRPATVILLRLTGLRDGAAIERTARALSDLIRTEGRETDRAVRFDSRGFRLLLPETGGRAARTLADRLERGFAATVHDRFPGAGLCVEIASAQRLGSLEEAVTEAEARLVARVRPD